MNMILQLFVFRDLVLKQLVKIDNDAFLARYCREHGQPNMNNVLNNPTPSKFKIYFHQLFFFFYPVGFNIYYSFFLLKSQCRLNVSYIQPTSQPTLCWIRRPGSLANQSSSWCCRKCLKWVKIRQSSLMKR